MPISITPATPVEVDRLIATTQTGLVATARKNLSDGSWSIDYRNGTQDTAASDDAAIQALELWLQRFDQTPMSEAEVEAYRNDLANGPGPPVPTSDERWRLLATIDELRGQIP